MPSLGTSFSTQGATPFANPPKTPANPFATTAKPTNPVSKALNTAVNPTTSTTPSIKSQKVTETTYHPPAGSTATQQSSGLTQQQFDSNLASWNTSHPTQNNSNQPGIINVGDKVPVEPVQKKPDPNAPPTYGGLINKGSEYLTQAGDIAKQEGLLRQSIAKNTQDVMGNPNYSGSVKIGQAANIAQQQGAQLTGLADQEKALTAQGQAYNTAAGLAAPIQVPYSNQIINPITGQPTGGGNAGTLPQDAQNVINTYAQQVKDGKMTRQDAESRLSAYGVAGTNALTQALGTGFNTNASNASAGTTATGQQVKTAADSTNRALDTLSTAFSSLPGWQTGGIPASNSIANWIGQQLGQQALSAYKTNLADARSQLIGVLNSSGGTPTGNEATANQYLPDNMTKAQFDANVGTPQNPGIVRQLIDQKVQAFTGSGAQGNASQSSGGIFNW